MTELKSDPFAREAFTLDQGTCSDLQIDGVLLNPYLEKLRSEPAKALLRYRVSHPYSSVDGPLARQQAISILKSAQDLEKLNASVDEFNRIMETFDNEKPQYKLEKTMAHLKRGSWFGLIFRAGVGLVAGVLESFLVVIFMIYCLEIPLTDMRLSAKVRTYLSELRLLMELVTEVSKHLKYKESSLLQSYAERLSSTALCVESEEYKRLKRMIRRNPVISLFDLTVDYSRFSLNGLVREVTFALSQDIQVVQEIFCDLDILIANGTLPAPGYVFPQITERSTGQLKITGGHHPWLYHRDPENSVGNDVLLKFGLESRNRLSIITGLNAGGKSTYLKMTGGLVALALSGNLVPAVSMQVPPMSIFTNMRANENLEQGQSFFYAQALRIKELDEAIQQGEFFLVIFDELGTGTSPGEKKALERTVVSRILARDVIGQIATHEHSLAQLAEAVSGMFNLKVGETTEDRFHIVAGRAYTSEAQRVLMSVGFDDSFLQEFRNNLRGLH